jgi:hypothetical protein
MSTPPWAAEFLAWLADQPLPLVWLQVRLGPGWTLCHAADDPRDELEPVADWLTLARRDAAGRYRPLPTAPDLRRGWIARELSDAELIAALETLYPGCLALWRAERGGRLRVVDFAATQRRQTGWQGLVKRLEAADLAAAAACFCHDGACLRRVLWRLGDDPPAGGAGLVPCPEACSLWLAFVQRIARLRRGEPSGGGADPRWQAWLAARGAADIAGDSPAED